MLLVTQGCNRIFFTENKDCIEVEGRNIILTRDTGESFSKRYVLGACESRDRAIEVLQDVVNNLDARGIIMPGD